LWTKPAMVGRRGQACCRRLAGSWVGRRARRGGGKEGGQALFNKPPTGSRCEQTHPTPTHGDGILAQRKHLISCGQRPGPVNASWPRRPSLQCSLGSPGVAIPLGCNHSRTTRPGQGPRERISLSAAGRDRRAARPWRRGQVKECNACRCAALVASVAAAYGLMAVPEEAARGRSSVVDAESSTADRGPPRLRLHRQHAMGAYQWWRLVSCADGVANTMQSSDAGQPPWLGAGLHRDLGAHGTYSFGPRKGSASSHRASCRRKAGGVGTRPGGLVLQPPGRPPV